MNRRTVAVLVTGWILSLVGVALWAQVAPRPWTMPGGKPIGDVITGENIGFQRVDAPEHRDGSIRGWWMIKVDGQWRTTAQPIR